MHEVIKSLGSQITTVTQTAIDSKKTEAI
jgi:hypothetical protein